MAKAGTFINYGEIATTFDCRPVQNGVVFGPPLLDTQVKRAIMFTTLCTPQHTISFIGPSILYCFEGLFLPPPMRIPLFSRLLPILICSLTLIFAVSGQCLRDQRTSLLELKSNLKFNSTLSTKLVRWNESVDCCSWEGVTCSEGCVVGLYLDNESIFGKLDNSSSLFHLHCLQELSLANNYFTDSYIPPEFGTLTNLSYLNLSNAGIIEQIPIEISRLTSLVTLDLSINKLDLKNPNLAMLVQNLTRLTELYLDGIPISLQGKEWCQALSSSLPNLKVLSMSYCNLQGPPDSSLLKLQSLSIINLNLNNFNAPVPEFFADFKNLTSLNLSYCGLNG